MLRTALVGFGTDQLNRCTVRIEYGKFAQLAVSMVLVNTHRAGSLAMKPMAFDKRSR